MNILNKRISKYVNKVLDEYRIELTTPDIQFLLGNQCCL